MKKRKMEPEKSTNKKPSNCFICGTSFSTENILENHIKCIHENQKPHKCSICDYSCYQKGTLKQHCDAVHEKRSHINAQYVIIAAHKNGSWDNILN